MSELAELISDLKKYQPFGDLPLPSIFNFVLNYNQFIQVLERISGRVGWENAKNEIAIKIKSMVVNYQRYGTPVGKEFLHTLITGLPGVGKTMFGSDLAELWAVSGCLKRSTIEQPKIQILNAIPAPNPNLGQIKTMLNRLRRKNPRLSRDIQLIKNQLNSTSQPAEILPIFIPSLPFNPIEFGRTPIKVKFTVLTRGDFVGKYQGHSLDKIRSIFKEHEGGVIMIDEAYSLTMSDRDDFGHEVLTEINNYMTQHPDRIIFIFAGYKEQINQSIMAIQPGLSRRFNWKFDINGYTDDELFQILIQQLSEKSLNINPDDMEAIKTTFTRHKKDGYFPFFGGDSERLSNYIKDTYHQEVYQLISENKLDDSLLITKTIFEKALARFIKNIEVEKPTPPPFGLYN